MGAYGWHAYDVRKHTIKEVVTVVLADEREWEPGRQVPLAVEEDEDCMVSMVYHHRQSFFPELIWHGWQDSECYKWEFGDFGDKDIVA